MTTIITSASGSPGETGQAGELRLTFERRGDRTVLAARHSSAPFGSVRASYADSPETPEVQVTNPSGGVLGGDSLSMSVSVGPGATAIVTTQGATKAYRGESSRQDAVFEVGDGATLEYLPHHVIPYADSSFSQSTEIRLSEDATLLAWDAFSAGRVARGERFAFDALSAKTRILRGGSPVVVDGMELRSGGEPFGGYSYLGAVYVISPEDVRGLAEELHSGLAGLYPELRLLASASAVFGGCCTARLLAADSSALYDALGLCRRLAGEVLGLPEGRIIS